MFAFRGNLDRKLKDQRLYSSPLNDPPILNNKRWRFGLFDGIRIGGIPLCLETLLCRYVQVSSQYNSLSQRYGPDWFMCSGLFLLDLCAPFTCPFGLAFLLFNYIVRKRIKEKYNIISEEEHDLLAILLCPYCALCQQNLELTSRGYHPSGIFLRSDGFYGWLHVEDALQNSKDQHMKDYNEQLLKQYIQETTISPVAPYYNMNPAYYADDEGSALLKPPMISIDQDSMI